MNKSLMTAFCAALALSTSAMAAENPLGQAVQKLHLTAPQLLSLRDFLSGFNRGAEVEASEGGLFILRDTASMEYAGEFSLRVRADGAFQADRVAGPATLVVSRTVQLPFHLLAKARAQAMAVLAGSQVLLPRSSAEAETPADAPPPALPIPQLAGLRLTGGRIAAAAVQWRAVFFPDGSGTVSSLRAAPDASTAPLRLTSRYYAPVRSDGARVWRDAVLEFDSDVQLRLPDLESRYSCAGPEACRNLRAAAPTAVAFHMIRWQHQLIAAVPAQLLAQLAPAPPPLSTSAQPAPSVPAPTTPNLPPDSPPSSPAQF